MNRNVSLLNHILEDINDIAVLVNDIPVLKVFIENELNCH